jgi:hypothetical protein
VVVKTHNGPEDDCAAIYVVRNGLAATVSYRHYLRAFGGQEATWEEVVGPCPPFGNWSSHLDAWKPLDRPRTLVIRYEDILAEPARVIERLSAFLGLKAAAAWANPFTELQRQEPDFFRKGQSGEPEELTPAERHAFLAMHRPWMERLGYDC